MQRASSTLALLAVFFFGCDADADVFPELKPCEEAPDGYQLNFRDGPDFYVWAIEPESDSAGSAKAIIYFGTAPNPKGLHSSRVVAGNLAGRSAFWSEWSNANDQLSEALVEYRHDDDSVILTLHSIVTAPEKDDLVILRDWISSVTFCQREVSE